MATEIRGYVARLITDDELLLNVGSHDGVEQNMIFKILDPTTMEVTDPKTGENLGSIERVKAQVVIWDVSDRLSLAKVYPARGITGLSAAAAIISGAPKAASTSGKAWPEDVRTSDPAVFSGRVAGKKN
jgi:hypothetical protein